MQQKTIIIGNKRIIQVIFETGKVNSFGQADVRLGREGKTSDFFHVCWIRHCTSGGNRTTSSGGCCFLIDRRKRERFSGNIGYFVALHSSLWHSATAQTPSACRTGCIYDMNIRCLKINGKRYPREKIARISGLFRRQKFVVLYMYTKILLDSASSL